MWARSNVTKIFKPSSRASFVKKFKNWSILTVLKNQSSLFINHKYFETLQALWISNKAHMKHLSSWNSLCFAGVFIFTIVGIKSEFNRLKISIDRLVKTFPDNTILLLPQKPFFHFPRNQTVIFHTCKWLYFCKIAVLWNLRTIPRTIALVQKPNQDWRELKGLQIYFYLFLFQNRL